MIWLAVFGLIIAVAGGLIWLIKNAPTSRFPPGSKAFEAQMTLPLVAQAIAAREERLEGGVDEGRRIQLEEELGQLREQLAECQEAIARNDLSQGRGSIGIDLPITPD